MKKFVTALFLGTLALGLFAAELQTAEGASITVRTRTQFDVSLDNSSRYGLATSVPELSLNFVLAPWQKIGDKPRSSQPQGFLQFELDKMEIRYTNGAVKDYNGGDPAFGFKFNDSKSMETGYFGPVYMPNMRAGLVWGDWTLQLAAAGATNFFNPWNRDYDHSYQQLIADWAYLDTRVQYRRGTVADYLADRTVETNYWSYDQPSPNFDDLATDYTTGALVGLEYAGKTVAGRLKFNTRYPLATLPANETNGLGLGGDLALTPFNGLTSTTSAALRLNYKGTASPEQMGVGTKLAYDIPLSSFKGLSLTPLVGYDFKQGLSLSKLQSQEASVGLTVHWPGTEGWAQDLLHDRTGAVYSGATVAFKVYQADLTNAQLTQTILFTLYEDPDDTGLIKGLGSEIVVERVMSPSATNTQVSAYFDWTAKLPRGALVPWTRVLYDHEPGSLVTEVGCKLEKVIPKTLFGLTWLSNDLTRGASGNKFGIVSLYADLSL